MAYTIDWEERAKRDVQKLRQSGNKAIFKKFTKLLEELQEHPRTGTGQVEHLKGYIYEETWSRRLSKEHRIVYEIHDNTLVVLMISAYGHYGDK